TYLGGRSKRGLPIHLPDSDLASVSLVCSTDGRGDRTAEPKSVEITETCDVSRCGRTVVWVVIGRTASDCGKSSKIQRALCGCDCHTRRIGTGLSIRHDS